MLDEPEWLQADEGPELTPRGALVVKLAMVAMFVIAVVCGFIASNA